VSVRGASAGARPIAKRRSRSERRKRLTPYALLAPGGLWLTLLFLVPVAVMASISLQTGNLIEGFRQTFHFANYLDGISLYRVQLVRSIEYGSIATLVALVVSYPMAYWIAFHGGRNKSTYLLLILLPFFVSFVIRTLSWQFILSDQGILFGPIKSLNLLPQDFHVLATSFAVVCGLTYNFLPFMALPLYVSLERIDRNLVEAASDLYANRAQAFWRVIFPLSIPGIFAGILLTFIPAAADPLNAAILGGTNTTMVGNIIQTLFLVNNDYPLASALSFILMTGLLIGVFAYARALGTEQIQDYVR
jgi:spermidine/putrescine transport system permease protein